MDEEAHEASHAVLEPMNPEQFEQIIVKDKKTAFVFFSAAACNACHIVFKRRVAALYDEVRDTVPFYNLSISNHRDFAEQLKIRYVPMLALFSGGRLVLDKTGAGIFPEAFQEKLREMA